MGPLLQTEFLKQLRDLDLDLDQSIRQHEQIPVELISHIGGHKFAGNVIIYQPARWRLGRHEPSSTSLAGTGIWYGRVEPKHVQGVIHETLLGGRVIADLFRGGIDQVGEILML